MRTALVADNRRRLSSCRSAAVASECSSSDQKVSRCTASSSRAVAARTVAVRGASASSPISPKTCPGPSVPTSTSWSGPPAPAALRRVTATYPRTMMYSRSAGSPCRTTVSPAAKRTLSTRFVMSTRCSSGRCGKAWASHSS
jgi:hypothetical protein